MSTFEKSQSQLENELSEWEDLPPTRKPQPKPPITLKQLNINIPVSTHNKILKHVLDAKIKGTKMTTKSFINSLINAYFKVKDKKN